MNKGLLRMSEKERRRMMVLDRVEHGQYTLRQAATLLKVSLKQARRSFVRYEADGAAGLVHKSRGRSSNRARSDEFRRMALDRYRERYTDFGPALAAEKLAKEGFALDHETLRRWLMTEGLWSKKRKRRAHRRRREPKAHFGELVQMDGSHHAWFGTDKEQTCLIVMVDDATKTKLAVMDQEETIAGCMKALRLWIERYGVPQALYTDRKNIFVTDREPTIEEQLSGRKPLTVFARACDKLGIPIILANSPQAKGRVERTNGIYQDRFVKELKLRAIATIDKANELLLGGFNDELNAKFTIAPADPNDFHRPVPVGLNLDTVLCIEHTRTLQNDWTVRLKGCIFQILKTNAPLPRPGQKIIVRKHLDGTISLWQGERRLKYSALAEHTQQTRSRLSYNRNFRPPMGGLLRAGGRGE